MNKLMFLTGAPSLEFTFDAASMFEWCNVILQALTPVLYITLGISLGWQDKMRALSYREICDKTPLISGNSYFILG